MTTLPTQPMQSLADILRHRDIQIGPNDIPWLRITDAADVLCLVRDADGGAKLVLRGVPFPVALSGITDAAYRDLVAQLNRQE